MTSTKDEEYPRVLIENNRIIILYESGERTVWGIEADTEKAEAIALEIETGLRAIKYVKINLIDFIENMADTLVCGNTPEKMLHWIIDDAFGDIYRRLPEITKSLTHNIGNK